MSYQVVRLGDLRDPDLDRRWDDVHGVARMTPEKKAALLSNPSAAGDDEPVQLLAVRGREPIGRMDLIAGELLVRGVRTRVGWGSMLTVPEQHRSTLAGAFIVMRAGGLFPIVGAHGPSRMAAPLYEKLGFSGLPLERMFLLRHSRSVMERKLGTGPMAKIAAGLADAALWGQRALISGLRAVRTSGLQVLPEQRMDAALDEALNAGPELVRPMRSAAWINWVLSHGFEAAIPGQPATTKRLFMILRHGKTVGYFLTKLRFFPVASAGGFKNVLLGSLMDWQLFEPVADEAAVVLLAIRELSAQGADAIETCVGSNGVGPRLKRLGMVRLGTTTCFVKAGAQSPLREAELLAPGAWRLRHGDGDNLLF